MIYLILLSVVHYESVEREALQILTKSWTLGSAGNRRGNVTS
jgi:hypothetical protein